MLNHMACGTGLSALLLLATAQPLPAQQQPAGPQPDTHSVQSVAPPVANPPKPYVVDPTVKPITEALPNNGGVARPLAAIRDNGHSTTFVANEVIYTPEKPNDLADFLTRYHGKVVRDSSIPPPPSGLVGRPMPAEPPSFVIQVDPSIFDPKDMQADAKTRGVDLGNSRFSSDNAAKLVALILHEQVSGAKITPSLVSSPQGLLYQVPKTSPTGKPSDAMSYRVFNDPQISNGNPRSICVNSNFNWHCTASTTGSNVFKAWQFVGAHLDAQLAANITPYRPKVAVLDGGFWLDSKGDFMTDPAGGSPLSCRQAACPSVNHPWQHNFGSSFDSSIAQGVNPTTCTGGSICHWHGTTTSNVALANLSYPFDGAGTGGQVGDPMLFLVDLSHDQMASAIRTAVSWGADIISISSGEDCGSWVCQHAGVFGGALSYTSAIDDADKAGVLVVSAAGNTLGNVAGDANNFFPCSHVPVLCVGALDDGKSLPRVENDWSSQFGPAVGIWAPSNIPSLTVADTKSTDAFGDVSFLPGKFGGVLPFPGTSASTPFVAGIAAMMKAMNPNLKGADIKGLLLDTAFGHDPFSDEVFDERQQSDGDVGYLVLRVNAYAAVVNAAGGYNIAPDVHIVTPADNPHTITSEGNAPLGQNFQAWAYDIDDSGQNGKTPLPANAFRWSVTPPSFNDKLIQPSCLSSADANGCLSPFTGPEPPVGPPTQFGPFGVVEQNYSFSAELPGPRTMTVTATNSHGVAASASVNVNVVFASDPPQPVIAAPSQANEQFGVKVPVVLRGSARSTDPGDLLGWTPCNQMQWVTSVGSPTPVSSPSFQQDGMCQATVPFPAPGAQVITLLAWNRLKQVGSASRAIDVVATPKFNFNVSLSPPSWRMTVGGVNATVEVDVSLLTGPAQPVDISVSGLPVGLSSNLSVNNANPPYSSILTLTSTPASIPGVYTVAVSGTGGGTSNAADLTLRLEATQ